MLRGNRILGKQRCRQYSAGATCSGKASWANRAEPSGCIPRNKYPEHLRSRQTLMTNSLPWGQCLRLLLFIHMIMKSLWFSTHACATYFHLNITVSLDFTSCRLQHVSLYKISELRFSETSVTIYQSTWHNIPKEPNFHHRRSENLKFWRSSLSEWPLPCVPFSQRGETTYERL
jgi:hypothetical protein